VRPPARELRSISFGLLGPDAAAVTYRTQSGSKTELVSWGTGAYLIVEPVAHAGSQFEHGGAAVGPVSGRAVLPPALVLRGNTVSAIAYRPGSLTCMTDRGARASYLVRFKAPYAVTNAASEYTIEARANCPNAPVSGWSIDRDVKRRETVKELSTSSFNPSACAASETLQVRYQPAWLAEVQSTQRPAIVGAASLRNASP
jgi:hypothetical protein